MNVEAYKKVIQECLDLGIRKDADYGRNIDSISLTGLNGITIRLTDKVCRLYSLICEGNKQQFNDESVRDTLRDIVNYAVYGIMLKDNCWKTDEEKRGESYEKNCEEKNCEEKSC